MPLQYFNEGYRRRARDFCVTQSANDLQPVRFLFNLVRVNVDDP